MLNYFLNYPLISLTIYLKILLSINIHTKYVDYAVDDYQEKLVK